MPKATEDQALEKLDQILRILVAAVSRGLKQREQIAMLDRAGFSPKAIADLIGTSSNTVRVELVGLRKAGRAGKG